MVTDNLVLSWCFPAQVSLCSSLFLTNTGSNLATSKRYLLGKCDLNHSSPSAGSLSLHVLCGRLSVFSSSTSALSFWPYHHQTISYQHPNPGTISRCWYHFSPLVCNFTDDLLSRVPWVVWPQGLLYPFNTPNNIPQSKCGQSSDSPMHHAID